MQQLQNMQTWMATNPVTPHSVGSSLQMSFQGYEIASAYRALRTGSAQSSSSLPSIVIPRIIWLYWESVPGRTKPAYLDVCLETIHRWNHPPFDVRVVRPDNIDQYCSPSDLHAQWHRISKVEQRADYLRQQLLRLHGGIWLDMDSICFQSVLPFITRLESAGQTLALWQREWTFEINNALIIATPQHPFIVSLCSSMDELLSVEAGRVSGTTDPIELSNWTELGSTMFARLLLRFLRDPSHGLMFARTFELRNIADIEPFGWLDAHQWTQDRSTDIEAQVHFVCHHMVRKNQEPGSLIPVLSFPNALIAKEFKQQMVNRSVVLGGKGIDLLRLALQYSLEDRPPSHRDAYWLQQQQALPSNTCVVM